MESQERTVSVRLLLFSGRPDHEWSLDDEAISQLRERVQQAVGAEQASPPPSGALGYRGFLIQNAAPVAGMPGTFAVYRGVLSEPPGPKANHWRDVGGVEQWLLAQARGRGLGEALDAFGVKG